MRDWVKVVSVGGFWMDAVIVPLRCAAGWPIRVQQSVVDVDSSRFLLSRSLSSSSSRQTRQQKFTIFYCRYTIWTQKQQLGNVANCL